VSWENPIPGVGIRHVLSFHPQETAGEPVNITAASLRLLCHLLLDQIPDEGLVEVQHSLVDQAKFYNLPRGTTKSLPAPSVAVPATIVDRYERPDFHFTEE
jgi:hypothetical protein